MGWILGLIAVGFIIYLYYLAMRWFFQTIAIYVLGALSVGFVITVLVNYIRAFGLISSKSPEDKVPAYKNYFFKKAYTDYFLVLIAAWMYNIEIGKVLISWLLKMAPAWIFTWPVMLTYAGALVIAFAASIAFYLLFGIIHLIIITLICLIVYIIALYFRSIELFSMAWRKVSFKCPHCYKPIALPVYLCPSCGEKHGVNIKTKKSFKQIGKLIPGSYGIFRRQCKCNYKLPTSSLWGRNKLESICPHCSGPLNKKIGSSTNIHIPIVGGPASGKTSFLMASSIEIVKDSRITGREVSFPNQKDKRVFEYGEKQYQSGEVVRKTGDLSPSSFMINIKEANNEEYLLYLYDAAGELYGDATDTRLLHKYFDYIDGILFIIDPFSIPSVRASFESKLANQGDYVKPSTEQPQDVFDRMVNTIRSITKIKSKFKFPISVIINKVDAFDIKNKIGYDIKSWLLNTEGNLVRSFEDNFQTVGYFKVSSLGHLPELGRAFKSEGVIKPIQYILNKRSLTVIGITETKISLKSERWANVIGFILVSAFFGSFIYFATLLVNLYLVSVF
ncbi:MAG: hypothetical protein RAP70_09745 [Candidatus Celaenobacter antarcticus]|nr:hypothetical protein [Candidatus Celaenobacter antarcticus]